MLFSNCNGFVNISASCKVDYMTRMFLVCYDGYEAENEDRTPYSKPAWKPIDNSSSHEELLRLCPKPWRYQNPEESDTVPKWGQFSFYPGGGFVADLGYENTTGFSIIENLKTNDWLDRQTRAVIVEFSAFNPSVNVLGIATYFYEVGASGYTATFKRIDVLSLHSTQTAAKQFYMICVLLFIVFVLLYLGREGYKLCKRGFRYFKSFWNWLELFQVFFSVLAVITHIVQANKVSSVIRKLQENLYGNVSFQEALVWREVDNVILGVLVFVVSVKLLRLIRFNKHVALFSITVKNSVRHLASFSVILLTLFVAFLHFGILIFGAGFERYSSVLKAIYFQLELTLGRVKARPINELALTNEMFGRIFAAMILLSITILAMNFFIVILNDALAEAKNTAKENPLSDPNVDECSWKKTNQRHQFYDMISRGLRQRKLEEALARSRRKTEDGTPEVNSRKNTMVNFDAISLKIKSSRKQKIEASENEKQNNPAKKSFFDQVSNSIVYLKHARNEHRCHLNNKEKKVRFAEDITKSQLRRLKATKKDLFRRLDSIVQKYSREAEQEEKFELILDEMGVDNSSDPMLNGTATVNESFD